MEPGLHRVAALRSEHDTVERAMKITAKEAFQLVKASAKDFGDDQCTTQAAALAYSVVFALPPLLVLILMMVSAFVSRETVQHAMSGQVGAMLGDDGAKMVTTMITQAKQPGGGVVGTILGIVALVLGATGAFMALQGALNRAWEVKPDPKQGGIKNMVFKRVLSLGMVLVIAFLLLVSLALSAMITALGGWIGALIPGASAVLVAVLQTLISMAVVTVLFAAIFKVLPDAEIAWRDVWVGALVTAVLFEIGKWGIGLYLGHSNPGKAYGAAGSLAVILVWIYYTAMILLFGAEFTQTWAVARGSGIRPEKGAVRIEGDDVPAADSSSSTAATGASGSSAAKRGGTDGARAEAVRDDREPASPRVVGRAPADSPVARERLAAREAAEGANADQSGRPGGGVGRREEVGGSGVHPLSAGTAPEDADVRTTRDWGDDKRG
jgi:membrane protein